MIVPVGGQGVGQGRGGDVGGAQAGELTREAGKLGILGAVGGVAMMAVMTARSARRASSLAGERRASCLAASHRVASSSREPGAGFLAVDISHDDYMSLEAGLMHHRAGRPRQRTRRRADAPGPFSLPPTISPWRLAATMRSPSRREHNWRGQSPRLAPQQPD